MTNNTNIWTSQIQRNMNLQKSLTQIGLTPDAIADITNLVQDQLVCGPECRQERQTDELKNTWLTAKKNLTDGPTTVALAEKNYYEFTKGEPYYENMLLERYEKNAEMLKKKSITKHKDFVKELKSLLAEYKGEAVYASRMQELLKIRLKENKKFKKDIDDYKAQIETSDRKTWYEIQQNDDIKWSNTIIRFMYYALLIIYIIFGSFLTRKEYMNWKVWVIIGLYILFPFIVYWLTVQIFNIYGSISQYFKTKGPKDVYLTS